MTVPFFAVVNAAKAVKLAEADVLDAVKSIQERLDSVTRSIPEGSSLNSLGELQGSALRLDVAAGRLELAVKAFESVVHYVGLEPATGNPDTDVTMTERLESIRQTSPRVAAILHNPSVR